MTSKDTTRPPEAAPEGRAVDGSQLCGAPDCLRTLTQHMPDNGNQGRVIDVAGVLVGSVACAVRLQNSCPVCGTTGRHACTQTGEATMARLKLQLRVPALSPEAVAR